VVARRAGLGWGARLGAVLPIDLRFGANLFKLDDGGWFSLLVAAFGFTLMSTWKRGRVVLRERLEETGLPLELFLPDLETAKLPRVPGAAVFMAGDPQGTPLALLHNVKHNKVVHEQNVLLTLVTDDVPYVDEAERVTLKPLGHGFFRLVAHHGFMEVPDVPHLLRQVRSAALPIDLERTSYFLGRERLIPSGRSGMARWREWLFSVMSQNAQSATTFFHIPPNQVVELGAQVTLVRRQRTRHRRAREAVARVRTTLAPGSKPAFTAASKGRARHLDLARARHRPPRTAQDSPGGTARSPGEQHVAASQTWMRASTRSRRRGRAPPRAARRSRSRAAPRRRAPRPW
jgi:hypothetical protein